jgi:hypothetical protein
LQAVGAGTSKAMQSYVTTPTHLGIGRMS